MGLFELNLEMKIFKGFYELSTSTSWVGAPELEGVSSPLVDLDGAVQVLLQVAWGVSSAAWWPVALVDLPESDIESTVGVVKHGMGISSTFVWDDAVTAVLVPTVFGTPSWDVSHVFGCTAGAAGASSTWTVSSAWVGEGEGQNQTNQNDEFHSLKKINITKEIFNFQICLSCLS